jgi:hypothetical protein
MEKTKFLSGEKRRINIIIDSGIEKKSKSLLKDFNESFSGLIENLLITWVKNQEEEEKIDSVVQDTIKGLEKRGSENPREDFRRFLEEINKDPKIQEMKRKMLENPILTPNQVKNAREKLKKIKGEIYSKK